MISLFLSLTYHWSNSFINNSIEKSKEIKIHKKEAKGKKPVIINNGVEDEPKNDNHIKITSIDELTKVPEKNEKVEATPAPVVKENPVNLKYKLPPLNLLNQHQYLLQKSYL